jgi:hypothetical protein
MPPTTVLAMTKAIDGATLPAEVGIHFRPLQAGFVRPGHSSWSVAALAEVGGLRRGRVRPPVPPVGGLG